MRKELDRFKFSLAVIDVVGIIASIWTGNWLILVYLALFNFLIIFLDVLRRGMIVHKPEHKEPTLPDELPIDPETGDLYTSGFRGEEIPAPVQKPVAEKPTPTARGARNVPSVTPFSRGPAAPAARSAKGENPFEGIEKETRIPSEASPKPARPDPEREEIEQVLEEWGSK